MSDTDTEGDEVTTALLWAAYNLDQLPDPPAKVLKAREGRDALRDRVAADDHRAQTRGAKRHRSLTRDEKRLDRHYRAVLDAYDAEVVAAYRNR